MTEQHTYLIGAEGSPLVKIGIAADPARRLATLQTGSPLLLSVLWTHPEDVERALHDFFAAHRTHGEWFDLSPLGDPVRAVAGALLELRQAVSLRPAAPMAPKELNVRDHLAAHNDGEWCQSCELWPHTPVREAGGWCSRCDVHARDHDDSTFSFTWQRLESELQLA